jgi:hypothetical protein
MIQYLQSSRRGRGHILLSLKSLKSESSYNIIFLLLIFSIFHIAVVSYTLLPLF